MNKGWSISRYDVEVVVVVAGDGEVPHPAVVDGWDRPAHDDCGLAVRRLEVHARFEVFCQNSAVVRKGSQNRWLVVVWMIWMG